MISIRTLAVFVATSTLLVSLATPTVAQWIFNGVRASSSTNYMVEPEIASDTFGGALVVWAENSEGVDPIGDLYVQRYAPDGNTLWGGSGILVTSPPSGGIFYRIVPDGEGGAVVAWYDSPNNVDILGPLIQRITFLGAKPWGAFPVDVAPGPVALVSGEPHTADTPANSGPLDLLPLAGGAYVAFTFPGAVDQDIFIQKVDASGTIQWGPDGVTVCSAAGAQGRPAIIPDGEGGAIVAWLDPRDHAGDNDIYAQRINFLGTPVWTANGVAVCTATSSQHNLQMLSDGVNGAFIVWVDTRNGTADVFAQRLNASGTPQWTANGEAIAATTGNQTRPALASDDRDGVYIMWADTRLTGDFEIFGQRVAPDGTGLWGTDGLRMTFADLYVASLYRPRSARDGNGGVISTYTVNQFGVSGVRAFNADSTGTVLWDEVVADTTTDGKKQVATESGSAIVAWEDRRSLGGAGIYAQKVPMIAASVGGRTPARASLDVSLYPSPFSIATEIRFVLPAASGVQVDVYNALGRRVATRHYATMSPGEQSVRFDAHDDADTALSSGVYFVRVQAAGQRATRKFVVMR